MRQRDTLHRTVCHLHQEPEMCKLAWVLLHFMCFYCSSAGYKSQIQVTQSGWDSSLSTALPRTLLDFMTVWYFIVDLLYCHVCCCYLCDWDLHRRDGERWWKENSIKSILMSILQLNGFKMTVFWVYITFYQEVRISSGLSCRAVLCTRFGDGRLHAWLIHLLNRLHSFI